MARLSEHSCCRASLPFSGLRAFGHLPGPRWLSTRVPLTEWTSSPEDFSMCQEQQACESCCLSPETLPVPCINRRKLAGTQTRGRWSDLSRRQGLSRENGPRALTSLPGEASGPADAASVWARLTLHLVTLLRPLSTAPEDRKRKSLRPHPPPPSLHSQKAYLGSEIHREGFYGHFQLFCSLAASLL